MLQFTVIAHFSEHIYHERKDLYLLGFLFIYFLFVLLYLYLLGKIFYLRDVLHTAETTL